MKRSALLLVACLFLSSASFAQQNLADAPACREDIDRYLTAMHVRDMMKTVMDAMANQLHQRLADRLKKSPQLSAQQQERLARSMDDMMKNFPVDEMVDAMIPVYQRHLTKGDVDALIAFYSTPTGQKILKELPAMTTEAMQAAMPIADKMAGRAIAQMDDQIAQMQKESDSSSKKQVQQN